MRIKKTDMNLTITSMLSVVVLACVNESTNFESDPLNSNEYYPKADIENGVYVSKSNNNSDESKPNYLQFNVNKKPEPGILEQQIFTNLPLVLRKTAGAEYIGVIPTNTASNIEWVYMDDEDNANASKIVATGAIPAGLADGDSRNTQISWAWVDGNAAGFRRLRDRDYVLIRMDLCKCPGGGIGIDIFEDNEDNNNANRISSNPGAANYRAAGGMALGYCFYPMDPANGVTSLPNIGFSYAIFAQPTGSPYWGTPSGYVYSDDEDSNNRNILYDATGGNLTQFCGTGFLPSDYITRFKKIIEVGSNVKRWYATKAP